jgi:hypothetical protein
VLGSASAISIAQWYNLRDTAAWTCCPPTNVDQAHWGLLNSDFSPKQSWSTMEGYLTGRTAPPPVSSLAQVPGSSPTGSSSAAGGAGQASAAQQQGNGPNGAAAPDATAPQGPRSMVATDDAARAHISRDHVDAPRAVQRAMIGTRLTGTWLQPWVLAPAAAVIVAGCAAAARAFSRRGRRRPRAVASSRAKPLDTG